jgi:hypothetical protein
MISISEKNSFGSTTLLKTEQNNRGPAPCDKALDNGQLIIIVKQFFGSRAGPGAGSGAIRIGNLLWDLEPELYMNLKLDQMGSRSKTIHETGKNNC